MVIRKVHPLTWWLGVLIALFVAWSVLLGGYLTWQVSVSQHRWCSTLSLLTTTPVAKPADPKAHVAQERQYIFYLHLKDLERSFGCSP